MANIIGINIYIDGVKHNSSPQPVSATGYNISDVKNPGDQFDVEFSNHYDDGTESPKSAVQTFTLVEQTIPSIGDPIYEEGVEMQTVTLPDDSSETFIEAESAMVGAVTPTSFQVKAKMASVDNCRLVVYKDEAMTQPVAYSDLQVPESTFRTVQFDVVGLNPSNKLYWCIESGNTKTVMNGSTKTLPQGISSHRVITSACGRGNYHGNDPDVYKSSVSNTPMFDYLMKHYDDALYFVHTGDFHYGDANPLVGEDDFHREYDYLGQMDKQARTYRNIPISYSWDDHDYKAANDSAITAYYKRIPHHILPDSGLGIYHSFNIGRVRYIQLDMRTYRNVADSNEDILGATQLQWLKDILLNDYSIIVNVINVGGPWNASSGSDNWVDAPSQRQEIIDFIRYNNLEKNVILIAGDFHGLGFDNGYHSEGIPLLHCGSIDSGWFPEDDSMPDFLKYIRSTGELSKGSDQFGDLLFLDDGVNVELQARGIRARYGEDGGEEVRAVHNQLFSGGSINILTNDGSNQDNNFIFQFEETSNINQADRYIVTVNNKPSFGIPADGVKTYNAPIVLKTGLNDIQVLNIKNGNIIGYSSKIQVTANDTTITYDSSYQAVLDYATSIGETLPTISQQIEDDADIRAMKAIDFFQKQDTIFKLKGTSTNGFKLICWKRLIQAIPNGNLNWTEEGIEGDGSTGWIDTLYNPINDSINYELLNAGLGYVGVKSDITDTGTVIGALNDGYVVIAANRDSGTKNYQLHGGIATSTIPRTTIGLCYLGRNSTEEFLIGADKKLTVRDDAPYVAELPNANFGLLARNRSTEVDSFSNEIIAFAFVGADVSSKHSLIRKILE